MRKVAFRPMGLRGRLVLIAVTCLCLACTALSTAAYLEQRHNLLAQAQRMQQVTLRVLATDLAATFEGFRFAVDADGDLGGVVWPEIPQQIDTDMIDQVGGQTGESVTIFGWDTARSEFVRRSTTIVRPDGTRAVGTILDPDGPARAALLRGENYVGEGDILGAPYLTIYVPVRDAQGAIAGALFAGVALSEMAVVLRTAARNALGLTLVTLGLAAGVVLVGVRRSLRPLGAVSGAMQRVADGDHAAFVPATDLRDPIGEIARTLVGFRDRLATAEADRAAQRAADDARRAFFDRLGQGLTELSEGNLDARVDARGSEGLDAGTRALAEAYNGLAEGLARLIAEARNSATSVRETAAQLAQGSGEMSHRAETQAATLEQSAAALDQMTASVKSAADKASEADGAVGTVRREADDSRAVVAATVAAMGKIEASSTQVAQIIGVIDDIAFQTNLLALNGNHPVATAVLFP